MSKKESPAGTLLDVLEKHAKGELGRFGETISGPGPLVLWQEDDFRMVACPHVVRRATGPDENTGSVAVFLEGRRLDGLGHESWSKHHLTDTTEAIGLATFAKAACRRLLADGGPLA